ncbi:type II toxin-antitoxin system VapC family toxin [Thermodesulfovibrio yellowstonii]|uniref:Ribonuclease VapC n=1 Tax=Thermodesulfovibrio yellowstonii TaxID=28262 RepID=A0A9W6GHD5_9BACT|nr:PIN domain-containing protein [Thermodesulfovibrio islandicus]GLI53727.1 PIN domain nuclease [Thermodesulfovibrio islandicus]
MKYLVDTNIFLEILLEQDRHEKAEDFLLKVNAEEIAITDLSLFSMGIILFKRNKHDVYLEFVDDVLRNGTNLISLSIDKIPDTINIAKKYNLDFDDAYQYAVAEEFDLVIVSFDKDFDRTSRKRKEPGELI